MQTKTDTAQARQAQGVTYSTIEGVERSFFRCDRYQARLSTDACAAMYRDGNRTELGMPGNRLAKCRSCPIGAAHAGETVAIFSALYGTDICPRCGKGTTRMIHGRICVSCRNREYELQRGRNAKGTAPVKLRPLFPIVINFTVNGHPRRYRAHLATDIRETIVQVLRLTKGRVAFGFSGDQSHLRQGRLF